MTLIINYLGGPSAGKSTMASGLFYKLKMKGINTELITEYAKDKTWEKNYTALNNQLYISANQIYRQERVENQVDVIVTDSPIILGSFYWNDKNLKKTNSYNNLLLEIFKEKNNMTIFVKRKKVYNPIGRNQTEEEAEEIDRKILNFLEHNKICYVTVDGTVKGLDELFEIVLEELNKTSVDNKQL